MVIVSDFKYFKCYVKFKAKIFVGWSKLLYIVYGEIAQYMYIGCC